MLSFSAEDEEKIQKAVDRLNSILPLKKRQSSLEPFMQVLHKDILYSYVERGRSLKKAEIARRVDNVDAAIKLLKENDLVVFDENGEPVGAYPFTMQKRIHQLEIDRHDLHCMCALDSLAVSPMFDKEVKISSQCHVSGELINIHQKGIDVINKNSVEDIFFGISWSSASSTSCCADSLCTEMIFLKGHGLEDKWQAEDFSNREIFDLNEAIAFAARFFMPIM